MFDGLLVDVDPADRQAWLDWRHGRMGASDVAGVLGISRWSSEWSVWADKVGLLPPEPENEVMEAGRWLETAIAPWFTHRTGLHVVGEQTVVVHRTDPIASATIDGAVCEAPASVHDALIEALIVSLGGFEVKILGFGRWDEVPAYYQAQAQWQMYVTGWERVWFAVLHGRRFEVHELERDDADIEFMVKRVEQFWNDHVVTGTPPAVDGSDATLRAIEAVYPHATPGATTELDDLVDVLDEWRDAKAAKKAADEREKAAKAAITAALGDAEEGLVGGQRVVTWREQTRGSFVVEESTFRVLRDAVRSKKEAKAS